MGPGNCPTPLTERTCPQIRIVRNSDQIPPQVEKILDGCMSSHKLLGLEDKIGLGPSSKVRPGKPLSNLQLTPTETPNRPTPGSA
jgi:hypothetical protein